MNIRLFDTGDEGALITLWEQCGLTRPWNDPAADIARAVKAVDADLLVGTSKKAIVASAMVGFDGHRAWVYYVAVAPESRGQGAGRQIMAAAEHWALSRQAPKLELMVRQDNRLAECFYEELGYEKQAVVTYGKWLSGESGK